MLRDKPIEELRSRAARFRDLASRATDEDAAQALLDLASDAEALIRAVEENEHREDES